MRPAQTQTQTSFAQWAQDPDHRPSACVEGGGLPVLDHAPLFDSFLSLPLQEQTQQNFIRHFVDMPIEQEHPVALAEFHNDLQQIGVPRAGKAKSTTPATPSARTISWVNPLQQAARFLGMDPAYVPPVMAPSDMENLQTAYQAGAVIDYSGQGVGPQMSLFGIIKDVLLPDPPRINPIELISPQVLVSRMIPMRKAFPVFVRSRGFGAGLAFRFALVVDSAGFGTKTMYYAVEKYTPFGKAKGEPYSVGVYAVPLKMLVRLPLACANVLMDQNYAEMHDMDGHSFTVTFDELRTDMTPEFEIARQCLIMQYPYQLSSVFATQLVLERPRKNPTADQLIRNLPATLTFPTELAKASAAQARM